jgi:hypothetical protein
MILTVGSKKHSRSIAKRLDKVIDFLVGRSVRRLKERGALLSEVAADMGLRYRATRRSVRELASKLDEFEVSGHSHPEPGVRHEYHNLLLGHRDRVDVTVFDHMYYKSHWGEPFLRRSRSQTLLMLESDELDLPRIHIWPRRSKLKQDEIVVDALPAWWSESYASWGDRADSLEGVLTSRVLGFFESRERVHLECHSGRLLYHRGVLIDPEQIPWFVEDGMELMGLLRNS